ncbi:PspC domain-containing protein [Arthrobacter sp. I2-34]|uniref:PspC domain-containing protein n=1 Tax=Arthrobacter hankyongi TaxID=2904801 RepID=A0ABS9L4N0_9MICC|nr:PspC domain-containing protein [Arthrobacter hankyongi]MCG2621538.1 PspC domain-containing protein [Arthrobacter hankyongi]
MTTEPTDNSSGHSSGPSAGEPSAAPAHDGVRQGAAPPPAAGNSFFAWLRNLGVVRSEDRWLGGVAAGVAGRIGLDPVLVRGLFILLAVFGGVGVLLYGAAWALLPEPDGRIHAEEAGRGHWSSGMTGAVIFTVLGVFNRPFGLFGLDWDFSGVVWTLLWVGAVIFVVLWLTTSARRSRPGTGGGQVPPSAAADTAFPAAAADTAFPATAGPAYPEDPAGYGPYLPPPAAYTKVRPVKPVHRGPSGAAVAVTLGAAMLLGGLVLALNAAQVLDLGRALIPVVAAVVLVSLGIGIVVAGLRGRSSGVLGFLAAVGLVATLLSSAAAQWQTSSFVVGTRTSWNTTGGQAAADGYSVAAGQGTIDLTGLRGTPQAPAVVPINTAAASVQVIIPRGTEVEVRSELALGNIEYTTAQDSGSSSGLWRPVDITLNDNHGSAPAMILQIRGAMSNVDIIEGPASTAPQG